MPGPRVFQLRMSPALVLFDLAALLIYLKIVSRGIWARPSLARAPRIFVPLLSLSAAENIEVPKEGSYPPLDVLLGSMPRRLNRGTPGLQPYATSAC